MGNPNIFEARLNQIKNILDEASLGELYGDLEIFEELLRTSDPDVFIKTNYDEFNNLKDLSENLIHDNLNDEESKKTFKLGVAVAQYQLQITANDVLEEIKTMILLIKSLIAELLELETFLETKEKEIITFIENNYIPVTLKDVLMLYENVIEWIKY